MARQLGGDDDHFLSYRTAEYKLHYFETPTQLKFVMLTDTRVGNMRTVLHQIWATLYVEFVVKSPLSPVEHAGGVGVANELFEGGLERFIVRAAFVCYREFPPLTTHRKLYFRLSNKYGDRLALPKCYSLQQPDVTVYADLGDSSLRPIQLAKESMKRKLRLHRGLHAKRCCRQVACGSTPLQPMPERSSLKQIWAAIQRRR